jgi:hypothetical protein
MNYRLASLRMALALMALAVGSAGICAAQTGRKKHGRPIEFSAPKGADVATNLNQLPNKKDGLKQMEEDLYKPVRAFSGDSSMDAAMPPPAPPVPVVPSKRLREQMDRRKNVFLLTPEDLVQAPTLQEMLKVPEYGPDGREKQSKTALELYYERQDAKRAATLKAMHLQGDERSSDRRDFSSGRDLPTAADDSALPPGLEEKEQALKKLLESDSTDNPLAPAAPKRSSFSDIFGLGEVTPTKEQALEHKKYMEEFSTLFETGRANPPSADGLKPAKGSTDASRRLANPFGVPDNAPAVNGTFGLINPQFTPTGPPDVNAQALGQPSLAPKIEPPKGPVTPTFTAPRRPF